MISQKFKSVVLNALDLDDFNFTDSTLASDVPGWDSLNHVKVLVAVEKAYGIRLKGREILGLKNVHDLQELVEK